MIVLCCLCGIPGAGKTQFCYTVGNNECDEGNFKDWQVVHIEFDNFCKEANRCVGDGSRRPSSRSDSEAWHRAQAMWLQEVRHTLQAVSCDRKGSGTQNVLLLIDDNLFYKSMRKPFLRLAREFHVGFAQVFFDAHVSLSLELNRQRSESDSVSESVIERMASRIEPPIKGNYVLHLRVVKSVNGIQLCVSDKSPFKNAALCGSEDEDSSHAVRTFWNLIREAGRNPEHPMGNDGFSTTESPEKAILMSEDHQSDLKIRRIVHEFMKTVPAEEKKRAAAFCKETKKQFHQLPSDDAAIKLFEERLRKWR